MICEVYCCYWFEFCVVWDGCCTVVYVRCTVAIGVSFVLYGMVPSQLYDM